MVNYSTSAAMDGVNPGVDQGWRLLDAMPLGLLVVGHDGDARLINEQAARLLGLSATEVVGRDWPRRVQISDMATGERLSDLPLAQDASHPAGPARYRVVRPDGSQGVVEVSRTQRSPQWPASWGAAFWLRDCTEDVEQLLRLRRLADRDDLTNLVNRREFERRLANAFERTRRDGSRHVLIFMDLDRFKQINDRFGHPAGDAALRQVAETLRGTVRERDTLGRLGGDEFGLLMEHCDLEEGRRAAGEMKRRLCGQRFRWGTESQMLGISVGLAAVDQRCADLDTVWQQADAACYRAKRAPGRYGFVAVA
jgi:diguanylate cyclase (GGDEF)-like protein/PAS domain S-box-containing protein